MTHHLSIDLETYSSVPIAKSGAYKYVQSPDFEILLFAYSLDGGPVEIIDMAQGEMLPDWLEGAIGDPSYVKHAYNAAFEWYCLSKYFGALLPVNQWRDTMLHGLYCGFTAGLDATGKALGLPAEKQKLATGKALIRYFCIPCTPTKSNGGRTRNLPKHDPEKWELFKTYCKGDVTTEMEVERRFSNFPVPDDVQKQWETDLIINARGVAVDMDMVQGALYIGDSTREKLMTEATEISGLDNPNSVAQLSGWLERNTNTEITDLRKGTVAQMLEDQSVTGDAERMLQIRQELGKTSTKKYDAIDAAVCADGRVRGLLQFYGANRTGRWAGRLVQVQNLPRTYIGQLPMARQAVKEKRADKLRFWYGSVPDTLSQLIRTSFIASPGNKLVDADFSAIEARVISWLAGEQWRLEVFRTHGKIYEASASQMFGVPIEKITKGNPEYALRQKGKVAELALGYQGGSGALITMGALQMGIPEEDLPDIVSRWRESNKRIVDLWYAIENAAVTTISTGRQTAIRGLILSREFDLENDLDYLTIRLPSGRKLFYAKPELGENMWGRPSILYYGVNQTTKQWTQLETYGGKIVENCLSGDSLVLTDRGWVRLDAVEVGDKVWDGEQWVSHAGLIRKGWQPVVDVDGVKMTPDHKIYTEGGWVCASQSERYNRHETRLPDSSFLRRFRRQKVTMEHSVRLRQSLCNARDRILERKAEVVRLYASKPYRYFQQNAWAVSASNVSCVALDERKMYLSDSAGVGELWRTRHQGLRPLVGELREFLERYVSELSAGFDVGPRRRERRLLARELPLGFVQNAGSKQAGQCICEHSNRSDDRRRSLRTNRYRRDDIALPDGARMPGRYVVHETGRYEQVYDLRNCGPNHRFTVLSEAGPMLVHNCVQAIARDCLAVAIEHLEEAGFPVVFHVHDEVVIDCPAEKANLDEVVRLMTLPIPWALDLPLNADGWVGDFFRKD